MHVHSQIFQGQLIEIKLARSITFIVLDVVEKKGQKNV